MPPVARRIPNNCYKLMQTSYESSLATRNTIIIIVFVPMGKRSKKGERWIKHYSSSHEILLVGEGDFSFSASLATAFGSAVNMVATSLDSKKSLKMKHSTAEANLKEVKERGCIVLHGVDANTLGRDPRLISKLFDRIVFNFPHAGFSRSEHDSLQILCHQKLVRGFLRSARDMMTGNGEVHVTHKTTYPFSEWEIEKLGEEVGLRLVEEAWFSKWDYPGYHNKRGTGPKSNKTFRVGECSTFKFAKP